MEQNTTTSQQLRKDPFLRQKAWRMVVEGPSPAVLAADAFFLILNSN